MAFTKDSIAFTSPSLMRAFLDSLDDRRVLGIVLVDANGDQVVPFEDGDDVDVTDRAARDLGKIDVAGIDAIGAVAGQAVMAASMPVAIASNQTPVAVTPGAQEVHLGEIGGPHAVVAATFARPADTTAYTAKDVVGNTGAAANLTFTNIARVNAGSGIICKARLMADNKALVGRYRLHLLNVAPTPIADNSPYLLLYANAAVRIGSIDFAAMATEDATNSTASASLNTSIRLAFTCAAASRTLYAALETLDAYTPVASTNYYVELEAEVN